MKNRNTTITLIILNAILVIVLVWFLSMCLIKKFNFFVGIGGKNNNVIFDHVYSINGINNIELLSKSGDIKFEESVDENIRVIAYGKNNTDIDVNIIENKLLIDYTKYTNNWMFFGNFPNNIIVYIPTNYSNEINIRNDYGSCKMINLENATINIKENCGDVNLGRVKNISVKCDFGDISISEVLNKCDIEANCGNLKIEKVSLKENSSISSDYGDIKIKETNDIYVDAKVSFGDTKINNTNRYSDVVLKIKADCGDVKIGG